MHLEGRWLRHNDRGGRLHKPFAGLGGIIPVIGFGVRVEDKGEHFNREVGIASLVGCFPGVETARNDHSTRVLRALMENVFDEEELHEEVYMAVDDFAQLEGEGHIVGAHSQNHRVLSRLQVEEQIDEIRGSFDWLRNHAEMSVPTFCYPYGEVTSYDASTLQVLEESQVEDYFGSTSEGSGSTETGYLLFYQHREEKEDPGKEDPQDQVPAPR